MIHDPARIQEKTRDFTGRHWVFQALDAWLNAAGPPVFTITGPPGSGKSALAARLVQRSRGDAPSEGIPRLGRDSLAYAHFCQAYDDPTLSPLRFVENLSLALADRYPAFAEALTETERADVHLRVEQRVQSVETGGQVAGIVVQSLQAGDTSARAAFDRVVRKPLETLCTPEFAGPIVILVDALDEAMTYGDPNIALLLGDLTGHAGSLPPQVRLILTSRHDPRVLHALDGVHLDLVQDAPHDVDEVQAYAYRRLEAWPEPQRNRFATRIAEQGRGNFLYARHVLDDLPPDLAPDADLERLELPDSLYDVYYRFLRRELGRRLERWDLEYAPLLGALAVARGQGLTRDQLAVILELAPHRVQWVLRACTQYLSGPQPHGPFRFYHGSFRDYLALGHEYQVHFEHANRAIAGHYWKTFRGRWAHCDRYGLDHLPLHLAAAEQVDTLRELLLSYDWLEAKLEATDVTALIADYDGVPGEEAVRQVQGALRLAAYALLEDKAQLAGQLVGRLLVSDLPAIQALLARMQEQKTGAWLRPLRPGLTAPGGPLVHTLSGHTALIYGVAIAPDGQGVVSVSLDSTIRVWDPKRGTLQRTVAVERARRPTAVALSPDGRRALVGHKDGSLTQWDLESGERQRAWSGPTGAVTAVAILNKGRWVASVNDAQIRTLHIWDASTGRPVRNYEGTGLLGAAETTYGPRVVSLSGDGARLQVFDLTTGQETHTLSDHDLSPSPDDRYTANGVLLASSGEWAVDWGKYLFGTHTLCRVWNLKTGHVAVHRWSVADLRVSQVSLTPDARQLILGSGDGTLCLYDVARSSSQPLPGGHTDAITALSVTPGGRWLVSASWDETLKVWDLERAAHAQLQAEHADSIKAIVVTPGGKKALSISTGMHDAIKAWNLDTGLEARAFAAPSQYVGHAEAIMPDGQAIIHSRSNGHLVFWHLENQALCRSSLRGHPEQSAPNTIVVSADGQHVLAIELHVTKPTTSTLRAWKIGRGRRLQRLFKSPSDVLFGESPAWTHLLDGWLSAAAITSDGRQAVVAYGPDEDEKPALQDTLAVYDLETGAALQTYSPQRGIAALAAIPGKLEILLATCRGELQVWNLRDGTIRQALPGHTDLQGINVVAVAPDGTRAVSGSSGGLLHLWDLAAGRCMVSFRFEGSITAAAIAPDGRTLLAGNKTGRVHILRLEGEYK